MSAPYTLRAATATDVPAIVDIQYGAFAGPNMRRIFPDTPAGRAWCKNSYLRGFREPGQNVVHMVMTEAPNAPGERGRIVAFARWIVHPGGGEVPSWDNRWVGEMAEGMSEEAMGKEFFLPMARQHALVMGDRPHYFLEVLATHGQYRKQGLGSQLLKWGAEAADRKGWESYLDATPGAKPLYEKHGYVEQSVHDEKAHSLAMLRPAQKKGL